MQLELTDRDYANFSALIYQKCGINLHEGKKELLKARLAKVLRHYNFDSVKDYYMFLMNDASGEEMIPLLDSISTNLTYFLREPRHFDFLSQTAVPNLIKSRQNGSKRKLNIWCAGCSSGEEPYSIAITMIESLPDPTLWEVNILATDISTRMLDLAAKGIYGEEKVNKIPYEWKRRYFQKGVQRWERYYRVKPDLRKLITFKRFNLMEPFLFEAAFEIIFCRNVMIYFDKPTQQDLVRKFHEALNKDGYLMIGHSESLTGIDHKFRYIQPSIYIK